MNYVRNADGTNGMRSRSQPPRPSDKGKQPVREVSPFGKSNHPILLITSSKQKLHRERHEWCYVIFLFQV